MKTLPPPVPAGELVPLAVVRELLCDYHTVLQTGTTLASSFDTPPCNWKPEVQTLFGQLQDTLLPRFAASPRGLAQSIAFHVSLAMAVARDDVKSFARAHLHLAKARLLAGGGDTRDMMDLAKRFIVVNQKPHECVSTRFALDDDMNIVETETRIQCTHAVPWTHVTGLVASRAPGLVLHGGMLHFSNNKEWRGKVAVEIWGTAFCRELQAHVSNNHDHIIAFHAAHKAMFEALQRVVPSSSSFFSNNNNEGVAAQLHTLDEVATSCVVPPCMRAMARIALRHSRTMNKDRDKPHLKVHGRFLLSNYLNAIGVPDAQASAHIYGWSKVTRTYTTSCRSMALRAQRGHSIYEGACPFVVSPHTVTHILGDIEDLANNNSTNELCSTRCARHLGVPGVTSVSSPLEYTRSAMARTSNKHKQP